MMYRRYALCLVDCHRVGADMITFAGLLAFNAIRMEGLAPGGAVELHRHST